MRARGGSDYGERPLGGGPTQPMRRADQLVIQSILRKIRAYDAGPASSGSGRGALEDVESAKQQLGEQIYRAYAENMYYVQATQEQLARRDVGRHPGGDRRRFRSRGDGLTSMHGLTAATQRRGERSMALMTLSAGHGDTDETLREALAQDGFSKISSPPAFSSQILSIFGDCQIKNKSKVIDRLVVENAELRQRDTSPGWQVAWRSGTAGVQEAPDLLDQYGVRPLSGGGDIFADIAGGEAELYESDLAAERAREYGMTLAELQRPRDDNVRPILTRSPLGAAGLSGGAADSNKRDEQAAEQAQRQEDDLAVQEAALAGDYGEVCPPQGIKAETGSGKLDGAARPLVVHQLPQISQEMQQLSQTGNSAASDGKPAALRASYAERG